MKKKTNKAKGTCRGPGPCGRPVMYRGLCRTHYSQDQAGQPLKPIRDRLEFPHGGVTVTTKISTRAMKLVDAHRRRIKPTPSRFRVLSQIIEFGAPALAK